MDPSAPLECQDSSFGDLDDDQIWLLQHNALDLVLLENAAELARLVMMDSTNLERVLELISANSKGCNVVDSQTFKMWVRNPDEKMKEYTKGMVDTEKDYKRLLGPARKKIAKMRLGNKSCIAGIFAVALGDGEDVSGHYCAMFYSVVKNEVLVFDSMQHSPTGSFYSVFFLQLATDLFDAPARVQACFSQELSLQITGGFSGNAPLVIRMLETHLPFDDVVSLDEKYGLSRQSTESQNHFCYMWSIWYIHHLMLGSDPGKTANAIYEKGADPLTVIKKYMWGLFNHPSLKLINAIPATHRNFFKKNFPAVWTNDPQRDFGTDGTSDRLSIAKIVQPFRRYTFPSTVPRSGDIHAVLKASIAVPIPLTLQRSTPLTNRTLDMCLERRVE